MNFFERQFLNNPAESWLVFAGILLVSLAALKALQVFLYSRLTSLNHRLQLRFNHYLLTALSSTKLVSIFALALFAASGSLEFKPRWERGLNSILLLVLFFQIGIWVNSIITQFVEDSAAASKDAGRTTTINALSFLGRIAVWLTISILVLDNLGVNVSALLTGLGIGGVAIALAVQNVLGDLLASLSIVLDKPFVIGDAISVGEDSGTVEHIGLKTTRLKSDTGEQLIFSNSDLLKSRIRNFKRMRDRRVTVRIGVPYETPVEQLAKVPAIAEKILNTQSHTIFERCHLKHFSDSAVEFEIVYWVRSPEYKVYMDMQHAFMLSLLKAFHEEKIEFAYPTQKIFHEQAVKS